MKKTFLMLAMTLGTLITTTAQKPPEKFKAFSLEALTEVNATQLQKKKFNDLVKEYDSKLKEIKENKTLSNPEKRAEYKKLNQYRNRVYWREILTKEQAKKLSEKRQKSLNDASEK